MKILQINKFYYKRGGAEVYMLNLSESLRQSGHQVIEFSMHHENNLPSAYSDYFVDFVDLDKREGLIRDAVKAGHLLYSFEAKRKLAALIKKEKPDVAHLHNFYFQLTPSILSVLKKYKIPTVWTMHDYKLICPNYKLFTQGQVCQRCKVHKYYNCARYKCIKNSFDFSLLGTMESYLHNWLLKSYAKIDLYLAPSKFLQHKVIEWGTTKEKVKQLYNFVNLAELRPAAELGEGLVYFGRLAEEKGLTTLLEAMESLPDIKLKIIGDGPQREDLEQYIKAHNLANIRLEGHKTGQELYQAIKGARMVVLPSIWYENNPISVLEAFALGRPVIGSDLGGIPELVQPGQTGFLFKAGDSQDLAKQIKLNYPQLELLAKMGGNALKLAQKEFNQAGHCQQIIKIYEELINKAKKA